MNRIMKTTPGEIQNRALNRINSLRFYWLEIFFGQMKAVYTKEEQLAVKTFLYAISCSSNCNFRLDLEL